MRLSAKSSRPWAHNKKTAAIFSILFLAVFVLFPDYLPALAQTDSAVVIPQPIGAVSLQSLIGRIIKSALGLTGVIALVMFIYGGFLYMTAAGNSERVEKSKKTMIWAVIGMVAVFTAYAAVNFAINAISPPAPPAPSAVPSATSPGP